MAKRRYNIERDDYDTQEEYEEAVRAVTLRRKKNTVVATQGSGEGDVPEPILFERTIRGWMEQWDCVSDASEADVFLTIGDIRTQLFGLVPFGNVDDPLRQIKEMLEAAGFVPVANAAFSGPVYQLCRRGEDDVILTADGELKKVDEGLSLF